MMLIGSAECPFAHDIDPVHSFYQITLTVNVYA